MIRMERDSVVGYADGRSDSADVAGSERMMMDEWRWRSDDGGMMMEEEE